MSLKQCAISCIKFIQISSEFTFLPGFNDYLQKVSKYLDGSLGSGLASNAEGLKYEGSTMCNQKRMYTF